MAEPQLKSSYFILLFATSAVGNFLCGMNLAGFNESAQMVGAQRGWVGNKNVALANDSAILGLMIGSIVASSVVRIGLKNSAIVSNLIGILGCLIQISDNIWALIIGKFLLGLGGGIMIVTTSLYIAQTLPNSAVASCGTSVNAGIVVGILLISIVQSIAVPNSKSQDYLTTTSWKICFTFPIITAVINILMWQFLLKTDSIEQMINQNASSEALIKQLQTIYSFENYQQAEQIVSTLKNAHLLKQQNQEQQPGFVEIFSDKRYQNCTFFCLVTAISNQLTASSAVPIVLTSVLSEFPSPINQQVGIYLVNGIAVVGAAIGPLLSGHYKISIRTIYLMGWIVMSLSLCMVVLFQLTGVPIMILISLTILQLAWQISGGSFFFVYASQIANETQISVANFTVWFFLLIVQTSILVDGLGLAINFGIFAVATILSTIRIALVMKRTEGLSISECKLLYTPSALANKQYSQLE